MFEKRTSLTVTIDDERLALWLVCGCLGVACGYIYRVPLVDHLTFAVSRAVSKIFTLGKIDR